MSFFDMLKQKANETRNLLAGEVSKYRNREFMESCVAGCVLVAAADGEIESNKKVNGYTFENWISDCKKRVKTIQLDEKVKYLEEKTKVVESYYSEDKRRQKLLEKTLADLKDLGID